jgi:Xaa-Pro aminopeptidase
MTLSARLDHYAAVLERAGADAFVLTSEAAVRHACGVHLYTQRLIPQRPVTCILRPASAPTLVACVLEEDQLAAEHPALALVTFREFGDDPWAKVAELLGGARRVIAEDAMPAAWLEALRRGLPGAEVVVSFELPLEPRVVKDDIEQELLARASRAAERALAEGAALAAPGRTEREVADRIAAAFAGLLAGTSEVAGTCVGPQNNRAMHHVSGRDRLPERGPVRLLAMGRVDGYWVLVTRMVLLGEDAKVAAAYERYLQGYVDTMAELVVEADPRVLYEGCRRRVAELGFELTTLKIGHGTGLDFRERPWLSPYDDTPLTTGMVLAFDYGLEGEAGVVLHLEDRVLITNDGPRRLSDGWLLADLRDGFRGLLL